MIAAATVYLHPIRPLSYRRRIIKQINMFVYLLIIVSIPH
jgi:hypothetical protein